MDVWYFLMELVMLLGAAFLLGAAAQRLRQSPIVGYLLAGTIVGPLMFNTEAVNQSAELGVSLLLFSIGLEFSFKRLLQMGRMAFGGGTLQVVVTMGVVALGLKPWLDLPQALTIGAIVALSSTAVVMRILVERSEIDSLRGRSCLAILLMQDIAIVPLVLMVSLFGPEAAQDGMFRHVATLLASAIGLGLVLYLLLNHLVPLLLASQGIFGNRELTVLLAVAIGLGASWGAHALGISPALGAFVAGMLLGESPYATQIRSDISSVRIIMVTLFFASVGMLAKPAWFITHLHWIVGAAVAIFTVKALLLYGIGRLFGLDRRHALATGITLAQVGEFSLVLAVAGRNGGLLSADGFDLAVSVIIALMFAAPYMVGHAFSLTDRLLAVLLGKYSARSLQVQTDKAASPEQVLVVGLGPAGQEVTRHLKQAGLEPVVIDINPQSRIKGRELGIKVHLGDAASAEILLHAQFQHVCMAVVTVPDPAATIRIVETMRQLHAHLPIAARCRYNRYLDNVRRAGADIIIDEETQLGHDLAHKVVEFMQDGRGVGLACRLAGGIDPPGG